MSTLLPSAHKRVIHNCRLTTFTCSVARWLWSQHNKPKETVYKSVCASKSKDVKMKMVALIALNRPWKFVKHTMQEMI